MEYRYEHPRAARGPPGLARVRPPLIEFEKSMAARMDGLLTRHMFRFVDPASQRTMAIRPDMTAQVARIAATRMAHHPRPVRLSYAGQVLKLHQTSEASVPPTIRPR